jgi:cytoskeletal protein CcmA (bactofilin family)
MAFRRSSRPDKIDTIIGEDSVVEGGITSKGGLRIDGRVLGDIRTEGDLMIGEKGAVSSNIYARSVYVAGTVEGTITTSQTLSITKTGKVTGTIRVSALEIAEGGIFQGESHMDSASRRRGTKDAANQEHLPHDKKSRAQVHRLEKEAAAK